VLHVLTQMSHIQLPKIKQELSAGPSLQFSEKLKRWNENINYGKKLKQWSNEAFNAGKETEAMKRLTLHRIAS
jgi:uncharacterized membrane protein